ncbi:MAG: N-acetyltransferase family protein [Candidatus Tectimicrobiota bacterium]
MPSYRFCRPDDLQLIARAYNACYRLHYPQEPEMSEERFKEQMTLFEARPGNCMVALERQQPVGVVVSSRRETSAWIQAIGCIPACQRQGIGAQLIEALLRKIAIQRTALITVDVPADHAPAVAFFRAVGFTEHDRYLSYQGTLPACSLPPHKVTAVAVPEALKFYQAYHAAPACWERTAASLTAYGTVPRGYVSTTQEGVQGYLLHRGKTILDLALAPQADALPVCQALLRQMRLATADDAAPATLAKVPQDEPLHMVLGQLGFRVVQEYLSMRQNLQ